MLKALEISGFKSFADKTRFEFPPGITVVVGPNGSGKSNIVDAIKWVLGEQSAKSLRGKDMSDVIFKGSTGAGARRPANAAAATIILDNSDGRFAFDSDEVTVGRRVYRSGESEYLVNGETARLKDVKDLFRGTGVGTDAYSLIEQGKVDQLLQANAKDRRIIFEEAAGISRFKAKKVEAERRLARVEGNLIRLADIVEEVGKRYRSVKAQASKAARYKEHSDRLQQLRTFVGMKDWRTFSEKLQSAAEETEKYSSQSSQLGQEIVELESKAKSVESELEKILTELAASQNQVSESRENIAQANSRLTVNSSRVQDLTARETQLLEQLEKAQQRSQELQSRIEKSEQGLETAELNYRDASDSLRGMETEIEGFDQQLLALQSNHQTSKSQIAEFISMVAEIGKLVIAADSQVETVTESKSRFAAGVDETKLALTRQRSQLDEFVAQQERLQKEAESKDSALAQARAEYEKNKSNLASAREHMSELTSREAGLSQRAQVIEELEKRLEGINVGAKELLQQSKTDRTGPASEIVGLVADLVSVNVQHAGIVDVALGEFAQYIVVDGSRLVNQMADEAIKVRGRVGIIQLDDPSSLGANPNVDLNGAAGVIGRADRLVQVQPQFQSFIRKLLGGTWVVKTLAEALQLHESKSKEVRFVTLDGEVVEADGTVVVGPKAAAAGLVSRRSELRALNRELTGLEDEIEELKRSIETLVTRDQETNQAVQDLINENTNLAARLSDQNSQAKAAGKQIAALEKQLAKSETDYHNAEQRLNDLQNQLVSDRQRLSTNELQVASLTALISESESNSSRVQKDRNAVQQRVTKSKVAVAKSEQQLEDLQTRLGQAQQEFAEHRTALEQLETQIAADKKAKDEAAEVIAQAQQELDQSQVKREELESQLVKLTAQRSDIDASRRTHSIELKERRDQLRTADDKVHAATLRTEQLTMQRGQLAERLQEDYGIDIASATVELSEEALAERDKVDGEITELRKKIGSIGNVNLDALAELEELESRYLAMDQQYQDLVQAKETLEKIISRINADSRKLFVETLEAIRQNFQKLFRQTFGGGQADIILEEGVDPLEAGVEIVATPPGKPQFSNSLLSGGEKALTAVSLLMAIFQFRPSPFCVLDEVDAPFDEANIGRFIDVLKSFLGWTKFVIVTHSKKTMTAATTLYGITMQESGVSKRVSVRFEDVSEDGHISEDAINRAGDDDSDESQQVA